MVEKEAIVKFVSDTSDLEKGVKDVDEAVKAVSKSITENNKKVEGSNKKNLGDYLQLTEVFGKLLPRDLTRLTRGFQSTQRQVQRTSRSFKVLKTELAALGIPLLILALTTLLENLEAVTDFLGITSQANRDAEEAQKAHTEAINAATNSTAAYVNMMQDESLTLEQRQFALDKLKSSLDGIAQVELDHANALERVIAANERNAELEGVQAEIATRRQQIEQNLRRAEEEKAGMLDFLANEEGKLALQEERRNEFIEENVLPLEQELQELRLQEANLLIDIQKDLDEETRLRELAAEAKRKEEQAARDLQKAQQDLQRLEQDLAKDAEEYQRMLGKTQEEQAFERLAIQQEAEEERARSLGASQDTLLAIEEKYLRMRNDLQTDFDDQAQAQLDAETKREEDQAQKDAEQLAQKQARLLEESRLEAESIEQARQFALADLQKEYEEKYAIAEGNEALLSALEDKEAERRLAIKQKYDKLEVDAEKEKQKQILDAKRMAAQGAEQLFDAIGGLLERGSQQAKDFAVIEVLVNQAKALSSAIAGASSAAAASGPGAPFVIAGYIASMVASVLGGFAQIKSILSEADAAQGSIGQSRGGGGGQAQPSVLVPQNVQTATTGNFKAFVVQSELQGFQNFQSDVSKRVIL